METHGMEWNGNMNGNTSWKVQQRTGIYLRLGNTSWKVQQRTGIYLRLGKS